MAPGSFTKTALDLNQGARVSVITLPESLGGIKILRRRPLRVSITPIDITMVATEFGINAVHIPQGYPDARNFIADRPFLDKSFDLISCDGLVL